LSISVIGLFAGLLVGLGIAIDGFSGFLVLVVFGALGFVVGKILEGEIDLSSVFSGRGSSGRGSR
jgi:hypothetical protein